jgi:hypothetical protein
MLLLLLFSYPYLSAQSCAVSVPATILDEKTGMFVRGIAPSLLHARVGNVLIPVDAAERIDSHRVIVLFDHSGSMTGPDSHARVAANRVQRAFLEDLFQRIPPGAQVLLGAFDQEAAFGVRFSRDPEELRKTFDEISTLLNKRGLRRTSVFDAIRQGLDRFGTVQPGDSIVVITDGVDNASKTRGRELAGELAARQVRLFTILFAEERPSWGPEYSWSIDWVDSAAELTGGSFHKINAGNVLWTKDKWSEKARQDLGRFWSEEVLSAYMLRFQQPAGAGKKQKWLLAIDPAANANRKMVAAFPKQLGPCPVTSAAK